MPKVSKQQSNKNQHPLALWRAGNDISQIEMGKRIAKKLKMKKPVPQKTVFEWENGTTPRVDVAEAIENITKGAVSMGIWKKWKKAKKVIACSD